MVVTPLHYPVAYAVYRLSRRRLSLLGLVVGSMVPDLEVPILYALYGPLRDRLVLHSILGGAFIVPAIGLALFPIIELTIKRVLKVEAVSVRLSTYSLSLPIGGTTYVILDSTQHEYNPLLWPLMSSSINALVPFGNWHLSSLILHLLSFRLFIGIMDSIMRNKGRNI